MMAAGGMLIALSPRAPGAYKRMEAIDSYGTLPMYDTNHASIFWLKNRQLLRQEFFGQTHWGDVLQNQSLFWVGEEMGFGFYRATSMTVGFVFSADHPGLHDSVKLPAIKGQLLDSTAVFAKNRCWFFVATQDKGKTIHQGILIRKDGTVLGAAQAEAGDVSWLGMLRGKCAVGNFLFAPIDDGIVRMEEENGRLVMTKSFPDTEPYVDSGCQLFPASDGLHVVSRQEIHLIKMS